MIMPLVAFVWKMYCAIVYFLTNMIKTNWSFQYNIKILIEMSLQCWTIHKHKSADVNTLRPRQNVHHFAEDIFKCILLNENVWITIKNSLKFVSEGPIHNIPALVQIMTAPGAKPLSEPMLVSLPMHICVTRPQWVKQRLIFLISVICPETNSLHLVVFCIYLWYQLVLAISLHWSK